MLRKPPIDKKKKKVKVRKNQYVVLFAFILITLFGIVLIGDDEEKIPNKTVDSISVSVVSQEINRNEASSIGILLDQESISVFDEVECTSSHPTIAAVINHKVYGLSAGVAKIKCSYEGLKSNELKVTIIGNTSPTDPENPIDPVDPSDPNDPTVPIDPIDPVEPIDPNDPTNPTDPVDPGTPGDFLTVSYIDVGQGESILIQTPNGKVILIDAGTSTSKTNISDYLDSLNIDTIDVLVASHPHADHIGGMAYIINNYEIGSIYMPKAISTTKTYETLLETIQSHGYMINTAKDGVTINIDKSIAIDILAPISRDYNDLNQYSIVIKITYGNISFLFMGDAGATSENELLYSGVDLKADVLKVGHHGSSTSTTINFLDEVAPDYAIISVGAGNSYGHPTEQTTNRLLDASTEIFRTDKDGTVVISTDGVKIIIE